MDDAPPGWPQSRNTVFWGRFRGDLCTGWGTTVAHPLAVPGFEVLDALFPDCDGAFGPSVDATLTAQGRRLHLLRTENSPGFPFRGFDRNVENEPGVDVQATYTDFIPNLGVGAADQFRPWNAPSVDSDPDQLLLGFRAREGVRAAVVEDAKSTQLQQILHFRVMNEACWRAAQQAAQQAAGGSPADGKCQVKVVLKTFDQGVGADTASDDGTFFTDQRQGGLVTIVGPIGAMAQTTLVRGKSASERVPAWTSWGPPTQALPFADNNFWVEISWRQFQALLSAVSGGAPESETYFGPRWNDRSAWLLVSAGYGQENRNSSQTARSAIEGAFDTLDVVAQ
jgi:hypothetical protein